MEKSSIIRLFDKIVPDLPILWFKINYFDFAHLLKTKKVKLSKNKVLRTRNIGLRLRRFSKRGFDYLQQFKNLSSSSRHEGISIFKSEEIF